MQFQITDPSLDVYTYTITLIKRENRPTLYKLEVFRNGTRDYFRNHRSNALAMEDKDRYITMARGMRYNAYKFNGNNSAR